MNDKHLVILGHKKGRENLKEDVLHLYLGKQGL